MKQNLKKRRMIAAAIAASSLALLAGCGSSTPPALTPPPAVGGAGLVGGGCVPINSTTMIPFSVTGMTIGSEAAGDMRVLAGTIPPGDSLASGAFGVVALNNGAVIQPQGYTLATFQGRRVDGTSISLSVTSPNGAAPTTGGYPYAGGTSTYNATGYIQVSPFIQSLLIQRAMGTASYGFNQPIINQMPGSYPAYYPNNAGAQICVSNVALSLQRTLASYANWLYMGEVYFYLTGGAANMDGQHGLAIDF